MKQQNNACSLYCKDPVRFVSDKPSPFLLKKIFPPLVGKPLICGKEKEFSDKNDKNPPKFVLCFIMCSLLI